jgi:hypothetical protein
MSDPTLLIHQRLNPAGIAPGDVRPRGGGIVAAARPGALLPAGEVCVEDDRVYINGRTIGSVIGTPSAVCASADGVWLAVGQCESGLALWQLTYENGEVAGGVSVGRFLTAGPVEMCAISAEHFLVLAVCGTVIDCIDIGTRCAAEQIDAGFEVSCLAVDDHAAVVIGGGQRTLALWTISGAPFARTVADTPVLAVAASELAETAENRFFATGHANGFVKFWVVNFESKTIVTLHSIRPTTTPIRRIGIGEGAARAVVAADGEIFCLDYRGSPAPNLRKEYAIECAECASPIAKTTALGQGVKVCANCHRFLCQNCLPNELGFQLGQLATVPGTAKFRILCPQCLSVRRHSREAEVPL